MGQSNHNYSPSAGSVCPAPMTRAALLALRNAGALLLECHYTITDYNRGTVGAAEITLHAVAPDRLSMDVSVQTTFDNEGWEGRYDITANRLHELSDNIGNIVQGDAAVDSFPWGVAAVNENRVNEGVINYVGGTMTENEISGATVNMNGGTLTRNKVDQSANLVINGGSLAESTVAQDANVTINSGANYENFFGASSTYNQVGTGYIRYSTVNGNGTVTNGDVNINNAEFGAASVFNMTGSVGTITNSTFGYVNANALLNIPSLTLNYCNFDSGSSITASGAARLNCSRVNVSAGGRVLASAGATLNISYSAIDAYGYMQATQGSITITYSRVDALGYISHQSTGTNRVDRTVVMAQANARFLGTSTGCRIYYGLIRAGGTAYFSGTSLNSYMYYCEVGSSGQHTIENATNARHYYNVTEAASFTRVNGNGAGQSIMYYCSASSRGYLDHTSIGARIRFYAVRSEAQSIARVTGGTVAANLYYSTFSAYYYALLTLTGGTRFGLHGYGRQSFSGMPSANGTPERNWP